MTKSSDSKDFKSEASSRDSATVSAGKRKLRVTEMSKSKGDLSQRKMSALPDIPPKVISIAVQMFHPSFWLTHFANLCGICCFFQTKLQFYS